MNIIILAAGNGKVRTIHGSRSLLSLNGETVLGRQVRLLSECGINEIHVVVSYEKEKIMGKYPDLSYIISKHKDEKGVIGSLYSLRLTKHLWKDTLVINGDTFFLKETVEEILDAPFNELGLCLVRETKRPRITPSICALKMDSRGASVLKNIKEPFATSISTDKTNYFRTSYFYSLLNILNFHWEKKIYSAYSPRNFIMDIDSAKDYKLAKEVIQ